MLLKMTKSKIGGMKKFRLARFSVITFLIMSVECVHRIDDGAYQADTQEKVNHSPN